MSNLNTLLDKFTKYDLRQVDSVLSRLESINLELIQISKKYNLFTDKDLVLFRKYGEIEDKERFCILMAKLKKLQEEIEFLFIEDE